MTAGMTTLEANIARLNEATEELRAAIAEAHALLKDLRAERRKVEQLVGPTAKEMVEDLVADVVKNELDRISPMLKEQSHAIYEKVGYQVDKIIDLSLGKEYAIAHGRADVRPQLAAKLREWVREEVGRA